MRTLEKWNNDLDEAMRIATSYEMSYGNPMSNITSYESSIGAPRSYTGNSLEEDGKSIYNQYKRLLSKPEVTDNDLMSVQQTINKVKSGVKKYGDKINKENTIASKKMDEEYADLREWEEWHTPSAEFRAKEKAA
jgi:DNA repair ATPase RecN